MVNLIFPITANSPENKDFFEKTKKRNDVNFLVGVTEEIKNNFKVAATNKRVKVIVFKNTAKKEEMINSLKDYAPVGGLFIVRSPISQTEINEFLESSSDITLCQKKQRGKIAAFFERVGQKIIKSLFGFTPYKGDVTAISFSEDVSDILRDGYNISYATRVDRWKGYSYSTVEVEAPQVKLEYNKTSVALMLSLWIFVLMATIAGTVVYFCFRPATFLSVFIWMAVIFMAVVAVLISISVTLLKITAGERYYGKAKEVVYKQKESKKEKIK